MSIWKRLVALFRFDFRSAFGSGEPPLLLPPPEYKTANSEDRQILPFELDIHKLDYIKDRRIILDWRDEFAGQMLAHGKDLFRQFSEHLENTVQETGVVRKLFPKPAAVVLREDFFTLIRAPLASRVIDAEAQLSKIVQGLPSIQSPTLNLAVDGVDPFLTILGNLGFRPSSQEELISKLNHLVFGKRGIIDCYLMRAQSVSHSLLLALDAKP